MRKRMKNKRKKGEKKKEKKKIGKTTEGREELPSKCE